MKNTAYSMRTGKKMLNYGNTNGIGPFAGKNKRRVSLDDIRRKYVAPATEKEEENGTD